MPEKVYAVPCVEVMKGASVESRKVYRVMYRSLEGYRRAILNTRNEKRGKARALNGKRTALLSCSSAYSVSASPLIRTITVCKLNKNA